MTDAARSVWLVGPRQVEIRDSVVRPPAEDEVRVRALCSAISQGTEMLVYRGEAPRTLPLDLTIPTIEGSLGFPIKYGYSSVGRIIDLGPGVEGFAEGDLVFAFNPHESCYTLPERFVVKLPPGTEPLRGAFLASVETAINAMLDAAPLIGERVAIYGQGTVGLLLTQLARRAGAGLIATADLFERRRTLSLALGADLTVDPAGESLARRIHELTGGAGADVVIEASGRPETMEEAIEAAALEGRIVVVSWYGKRRAPISLGGAFHRKRLAIKSSQVSNIASALAPRWTSKRRRELAAAYLGELRLDEMITHVIPFDDAAAAYRLLDERPEETVQVLLDFKFEI
ncbi:MAG TPA: zinc-binding alcohol dehydrogenase [Blastocatellia bacterium]|nr:zinc-binding alcohol dehydrogenase [Blastocatellia bacterium]